MIAVRPAAKSDRGAILKIIEESGLYYPKQRLSGFWLAEENERVIGIIRLEKHRDFYFLSSLGVAKDRRDQGIATTLLKKVLNEAKEPVYLYTIIPDFFSRLGFKVVPRPSFLPVREIFNCGECQPEKCVCMIYSPNLRRSEGE